MIVEAVLERISKLNATLCVKHSNYHAFIDIIDVNLIYGYREIAYYSKTHNILVIQDVRIELSDPEFMSKVITKFKQMEIPVNC